MAHTQLVDAITNVFLSPTLPKQPRKPDCVSVQDTHHLLTANAALIKSPRGGRQNDRLGVVLVATQYALVIQVPFFCPTDPSRTPTILAWTTFFDEKALLREHAKHHQQYDECRNVNAALRNQLMVASEDTYLLLLRTALMGYYVSTMLCLLIHLYYNYAIILATYLAKNDKKLREPYHPEKPLKSLYTRLNKCVNYTTPNHGWRTYH